MFWFLSIPIVGFFVFKNLIEFNWLMLGGHGSEAPSLTEYPFLAFVFTVFVGCFATGLVSLAPIGLACFVGSLPERSGVVDASYPLVTLREKSGISGTFYFLGAGSIRDVQYYFWYRRNIDGSISGGRTYREKGVRIYEIKDDSVPRMVTFKTKNQSSGLGVIWWLLTIDPRDDVDWCPDFYIPVGSIKEGYEL